RPLGPDRVGLGLHRLGVHHALERGATAHARRWIEDGRRSLGPWVDLGLPALGRRQRYLAGRRSGLGGGAPGRLACVLAFLAVVLLGPPGHTTGRGRRPLLLAAGRHRDRDRDREHPGTPDMEQAAGADSIERLHLLAPP